MVARSNMQEKKTKVRQTNQIALRKRKECQKGGARDRGTLHVRDHVKENRKNNHVAGGKGKGLKQAQPSWDGKTKCVGRRLKHGRGKEA